MKIAFYGAGGLGHEIAASIRNGCIQNSENWEIIGFFDDKDFSEEKTDSLLGNWLGGINELNTWKEPIGIIISVGNPHIRSSISSKIDNPLICYPNCIANDFAIADINSFKIGIGNIITGNCAVTTNISIGNFNLLNGSVAFGHDVSCGDYNVFMPGCKISGQVTVGNENLFGSMCFVKQCLTIGSKVTISPLSALLTKAKNETTYIGNPAKRFRFE